MAHDIFVNIQKEPYHEGNNIKQDIIKIEKARKAFSKKNLTECIKIYRTVENTNLLNTLDKSVIDFAERQLSRKKR